MSLQTQGFWNLVNFVIFAAAMVYFVGPAVKNLLRQRHEETMSAIRAADEAKREAEAALAATTARLAGIEGELANLLDQAKGLATAQAADIERTAKEDAERLRVSAKSEIERERQSAVTEIRKLLLAQAFDRASLELEQQMSPERQRELVGQLIEKVGDGSLALKS